MNSYNLAKQQRCAKSFEYFLYDLRTKENFVTSYTGTLVFPSAFFADAAFETYFKIYQTFSGPEKLALIKKYERGIGLSTFFCLYAYYRCLYQPSDILFIANPKEFNKYAKTIREMSVMLKNITKSLLNVNNVSKEITFENNSSTIKFFSEGTYEFRGFREKADLVIFDNAALSNYPKLEYLLESVVNNTVAEKVVLNFNEKTDEKFLTKISTEFKDKIQVTEKLIL